MWYVALVFLKVGFITDQEIRIRLLLIILYQYSSVYLLRKKFSVKLIMPESLLVEPAEFMETDYRVYGFYQVLLKLWRGFHQISLQSKFQNTKKRLVPAAWYFRSLLVIIPVTSWSDAVFSCLLFILVDTFSARYNINGKHRRPHETNGKVFNQLTERAILTLE